jgi:hypothetical protein
VDIVGPSTSQQNWIEHAPDTALGAESSSAKYENPRSASDCPHVGCAASAHMIRNIASSATPDLWRKGLHSRCCHRCDESRRCQDLASSILHRTIFGVTNQGLEVPYREYSASVHHHNRKLLSCTARHRHMCHTLSSSITEKPARASRRHDSSNSGEFEMKMNPLLPK